MKALNKKLVVYASLTWALTILALVFRIAARIFSYDSEIGYFQTGTVLPILYHLSLVLLVTLAVAAFITFRRESFPEHILSSMKEVCLAERIATIFSALLLLWNTISNVLFYYVKETVVPNGFTAFGVLMGFLSVFFFLFFQIPSCRGTNAHMFAGFAFILYFTYTAGVSYLDLYTPMNNPVKILIELSAITAMLYLLAELRLYTGTVKLSRYIAMVIPTIGFLSVSVFSGGFFSVMTEEYTAVYHSYGAAHLALLLFAVIRIVRLLTLLAHIDEAEDAESTENTVEADTLSAEELPTGNTVNVGESSSSDSTVSENEQEGEEVS